MADKTVPNLSSMGLDLKLKDLGDGSFALVVNMPAGTTNIGKVTLDAGTATIGTVLNNPDLAIGAKSLELTLSSGVGQVPVPDTAKIVGVKPVSSTAIRVGLENPEANGAATGTAVAGDLKKGVPVDAAVWTWFLINTGSGRVLHVMGGASDKLEIVVM